MKQNNRNICSLDSDKINPLYKNKWFGVLLLAVGIFCTLIIFHRLAHYVYEFDPKFSPIDYGRFNFILFFTVQSNIFVCFYLLTSAAAVFGNIKAQKIAFNPMLGVMVTTYIVITGLVYCCGIPLGFTPPFKWDNPTHFMLSFIQVFHHMIVPPFMLMLWFFPASDKKISYKKIWLVGIYPLVYSIFSIARGAFSDPVFYPYPFYQPEFFWKMLFGEKELNLMLAYVILFAALLAGIMIFVIFALVLSVIRNKSKFRTSKSTYYGY